MMRHKQIASTWFDTKKITALRERSQSYSAKEDLWSWYVLRRLSIFVTILFIKLKLTPNAISWLSAIFVVSSGAWLIQATPFAFFMAFLFYNAGYLLDCVDGEVARLTGNTSKKGYFIDLLIQGATLPVFLSMPLAILVINDLLLLTSLELVGLYIMLIIIIMTLFVPIAYQLTRASEQNERDPVNKIRTKSFVFEIAGVMLGLPGFFLTLLLLTIASGFQSVTIQTWYVILFLIILALKVAARFFITVKSFPKEP
ncbi:CDP-alcohol phosphatidyltransferase family protein [Shouchella sp. 1P09AA]|uniref:CDP-alcohol phosphatidyltransferase family protein n=2 Tax=unclassified Shouchella TaxID=2893065 RepID=UPI0039A3A863